MPQVKEEKNLQKKIDEMEASNLPDSTTYKVQNNGYKDAQGT